MLYAQAPTWPYGRPASGTIEMDTLEVNETAGQPSQATFNCLGFTPNVGDEVIVSLGWKNNPIRVFAGYIETFDQVYVGSPANTRYQVHCVDYTKQLNRRKVIRRYTNQSGTDIAIDLVTRYASGFTTAHVVAGLAVLDEISFTNQDLTDALGQLAKRLGGSWYCDYFKDVHLALAETADNPADLTATHPSLLSFTQTPDLSQVVTRVFVEGGGGNATLAAAAGDTSIALDTDAWYSESGGQVTSGPQRITYDGLGYRAVMNPTAFAAATIPTTESSAQWIAGAWSPTLGLYIAIGGTDVMTSPDGLSWTSHASALPFAGNSACWAAGLALFIVVGASGGVATSPDGIVWTSRTAADNAAWEGVCWSAALGLAVAVAVTAGAGGKDVMTSPDGLTWTGRTTGTHRNWVSVVAADELGMVVIGCTSANEVATSTDGITFTNRSSLACTNQNSVAWSPTLGLLVVVGGRSVSTSPDGLSWTTYSNIIPASSGSFDGLIWTDAGYFFCSSEKLTNNIAYSTDGITWFVTSFNWSSAATINSVRQAIYAPTLATVVILGGTQTPNGGYIVTNKGTAYRTLTGIPASGAGSILYDIASGDAVNLVVQVDDLTAQARLAALLTTVLGVNSDGIQEDSIADGRISLTEAQARGEAYLELRSTVPIKIAGVVHDPLMRAGKTVFADLPSPTNAYGPFLIQTNRISQFTMNPDLFPTYTFTGSTERFGFEDLLRVTRQAAAA